MAASLARHGTRGHRHRWLVAGPGGVAATSLGGGVAEEATHEPFRSIRALFVEASEFCVRLELGSLEEPELLLQPYTTFSSTDECDDEVTPPTEFLALISVKIL